MPEVKISGLFGQNNQNEANLISNLHKERIDVSGNNIIWYILNLTKTVGDFDSSDYENDTYDFLYNEEIVKVGREGRIYMPAVQIPSIAIIPTFEETQTKIALETPEQITVEFNLQKLVEISNYIKYAEYFEITNISNKNYSLSFDYNSKKVFLIEDGVVLETFQNEFDDIYNYFNNNENDFFLNIIYSKKINISDLKEKNNPTLISLTPNTKIIVKIYDTNFEDLGTQIIPKLGDIIKTYTNKIYEITQVYPDGLKLWNYIIIKIIAKKVPLTNFQLPSENYTNFLLNIKEGKF